MAIFEVFVRLSDLSDQAFPGGKGEGFSRPVPKRLRRSAGHRRLRTDTAPGDWAVRFGAGSERRSSRSLPRRRGGRPVVSRRRRFLSATRQRVPGRATGMGSEDPRGGKGRPARISPPSAGRGTRPGRRIPGRERSGPSPGVREFRETDSGSIMPPVAPVESVRSSCARIETDMQQGIS